MRYDRAVTAQKTSHGGSFVPRVIQMEARVVRTADKNNCFVSKKTPMLYKRYYKLMYVYILKIRIISCY